MWVIRTILALLFAALIILIDLPLHVITWLIEKASPGSCTKFRHAYARFGMKGIWFLAGGKATVIGLERAPMDRPVLFVGNHRSIFDIILAGSLITYPCGFVAKKELQGTPITLIMEEIHCLLLDREDPRQGLKTILKAIDYVKEGISMFIFPEGTRNKGEGVGPVLGGSLKIATRHGKKIVPVIFTNTREIFEKQFPWVRPQYVTIEFTKPLDTGTMSREEIKQLPETLRNIMLKTFEKNSANVL